MQVVLFIHEKENWSCFSHLLSHHFPPCFDHVLQCIPGGGTLLNAGITIGIHFILVKAM